MSVSKKYKRNRNYRKLKRAGEVRLTINDVLKELYNEFNHSQNYEITKTKVSNIIGKYYIGEWEEKLHTHKFIHNNTDSKENEEDMIKFFPDIMKTVPYFKQGNMYYENWQKFYDSNNSNNNPDMEDNNVMNSDVGVTQNYNYKFKEDADGTLKKKFRTEYGIMVGTNPEAAQDRKLYVISLIWAHGFNPPKTGGRKTRKRRKSKRSKHSKKSRRSRRRH